MPSPRQRGGIPKPVEIRGIEETVSLGRMQVVRYLCRRCNWYFRSIEGFADHPCAQRRTVPARGGLTPAMRRVLEELARVGDWSPRMARGRTGEWLAKRALIYVRRNGKRREYRITTAGLEALAA